MSDCSYQAMGFEHCSKTPTILQCHNCATRARLVRASTPHLTADTTASGYDLKRAIAVAPRVWRDAWAVSGSALEAEERRLYFDAHVDARQYAIGFHPAGDSVTVARIPSSPKAPAAAAACPGCAGLVFFTANDCLQRHYHRDRTPCAWSGRQRATVEHEQRRMARPPKPPTLREWLGDRVGEFGRWADVLREQPVPAGEVARWEWWKPLDDGWQLRAHLPGGGYITMSVWDVIHELYVKARWWRDQLQMALFTRHPDVEPEPARVRTWFGNEDI